LHHFYPVFELKTLKKTRKFKRFYKKALKFSGFFRLTSAVYKVFWRDFIIMGVYTNPAILKKYRSKKKY